MKNILKSGEIKLIVYRDGSEEKSFVAKILAIDDYGISVESWNIKENTSNHHPNIFLPWHQITRVKEVKV